MKVLIIEDEVAAVKRLAKLLLEVNPQIEIVETLDSIQGTINWFNDHQWPDLIFLDIHLADGISFEIFNHIVVDKPIVFTTAYDEYAIKAFKLNTIDYLLKPVKKKELEQAINKYIQWKERSSIDYRVLAENLGQQMQKKRFLIKIGQQIQLVDETDCAYFYTQNKITFLLTFKGKRYPIDYSLDKLEEILQMKSFFRINRQFIINIQAIQNMYAYSKSRVKVELNPPFEEDVIVSTERSPSFKKWLVGE